MGRRSRIVSLSLGVWLVGCGTPSVTSPTPVPSTIEPTTTTAVPTTTEPTTTEPTTTLPKGVDEREGTFGGRVWHLRSRLQPGDGKICLDLWWEDETDHWRNCYSLADYPGTLVWTSPTPPSSGTSVVFVVGLGPPDASTIEVRRGDVLMGAGDVFANGNLGVDRSGFAIPLGVSDARALAAVATIPGLRPGVRAGLMLPMEVVAKSSAGAVLARQGPLVGPTGAQACLAVGDGGDAVLLTCLPTELVPFGGFQFGVSGPSLAWLVVADAATVEMAYRDVRVVQPVTPLADLGTPPARGVVVFRVAEADIAAVQFTVRDATGRVVDRLSLMQFLGG